MELVLYSTQFLFYLVQWNPNYMSLVYAMPRMLQRISVVLANSL